MFLCGRQGSPRRVEHGFGLLERKWVVAERTGLKSISYVVGLAVRNFCSIKHLRTTPIDELFVYIHTTGFLYLQCHIQKHDAYDSIRCSFYVKTLTSASAVFIFFKYADVTTLTSVISFALCYKLYSVVSCDLQGPMIKIIPAIFLHIM